MLSRLAGYLGQKRSFIKVSTWMFGVPFGAFTLWQFGQYGGVGLWLFIAGVSLVAGWAWGHGMWLVCKSDFEQSVPDASVEKAKNEPGA